MSVKKYKHIVNHRDYQMSNSESRGEERTNYDNPGHCCILHSLKLNSSTIDELGSWCLEGLVEPGNSSGRGKEVSIVTLQAATAQVPSH